MSDDDYSVNTVEKCDLRAVSETKSQSVVTIEDKDVKDRE